MAVLLDDADRFEQFSRYLSGKLNDSEAARFESDWADNPCWTTELELDARMHVGLGDLKNSRQLAAAMRGPWWVQSIRVILAMAASVAVVSIAVWIWYAAGQSAATLLARAPTLAVGDSVAVMRLRSAAPTSALIELPSERRSIELRVMPDAVHISASDRYELSLAPAVNGGTRSLAALDNLPIGKDGFVRVYVDSANLSPGRYRILLQRSGAPDADEFLIEVSAPALDQHAD
jgi:hypothetical protein